MITTHLDNKPELAEPGIGSWNSIEVDGQSIGIRLHMPIDLNTRPDEILIDPIAYSVNASTPRDVQRSSILAKESNLVTLGLEMPGIGHGSDPLTTLQAEALRKGDWSVLGEAQWSAIRTMLENEGMTLEGKTVHLAGFSMGVSSSIGLIASMPDDVELGKFIAWEGVAWKPKSKVASALNVAGLMLRMASTGWHKLSTYQKKLSPAVPQKLRDEIGRENRIKRSGKLGSWLLPIVGMAKGTDTSRLANALSEKAGDDTELFIWNGAKSYISRTSPTNMH